MKRRDPRVYGVRRFPFSDVLLFLLDRKRKRFLACARNDGMGKRCGDTTLPPSYGRRCPEGAEVGFPSTAEGAFFVYRSLFPSRMKRRDPRVYGVRRFPFSDVLLFLLDRKRKRFLACARNDGMGKRCGDTTLPPSYGRRCPEGAEVGSRSEIKRNGEGAFSHITFPSTAEGAFFVYRSLFPSRMKRRDLGAYGVPCFPFSDARPFLS